MPNEYDLMEACELFSDPHDGWPERYTVGLVGRSFALLDERLGGKPVPFTETQFISEAAERCQAYNDAYRAWIASSLTRH